MFQEMLAMNSSSGGGTLTVVTDILLGSRGSGTFPYSPSKKYIVCGGVNYTSNSQKLLGVYYIENGVATTIYESEATVNDWTFAFSSSTATVTSGTGSYTTIVVLELS